MDGVKVGIIVSQKGFDHRIRICDEEKQGTHKVIIAKYSGDANSFQPEPPFICYSVLRKETSLSGIESAKWLHLCFTANEAAHVAVLAKERMKVVMEKKMAELAVGKDERLAALEADLSADFDEEEDLGIIDGGTSIFSDY